MTGRSSHDDVHWEHSKLGNYDPDSRNLKRVSFLPLFGL
eukprot:CAMPEP_0172376130 /NCGR_PEP_ID=MMETSP1060-20121228/65243_1 /TAXON_ID=37318 /ORGANISM="Pseudo-nitzschia pungens, Strain cf. cingulata" /LENGTH=38 /DNA_ID= /DNA_START= /DNA_END= /DNA_ORIENTATION=